MRNHHMQSYHTRNHQHLRKEHLRKALIAMFSSCLMLTLVFAPCCVADSDNVDKRNGGSLFPTVDNNEFTEKYKALTKQILLAGMELERFNLNYRINSSRQPKSRNLRFFIGQEAGAGGILSFECAGDKQFAKGVKNPLSVHTQPLQGGLLATSIGAMVAGAGSGLELGSNALICLKNKKNGFDRRSAISFVKPRMKHLEELLAEQESLVAANAGQPGYARAVVEGKILRQLEYATLNEYSQFHIDGRGYAVFTNSFYALNLATNALAATASGYAYRAAKEPKFNGAADVLFIVTGGLASVAPWLSQIIASKARTADKNMLAREFNNKNHFDPSALAALRQQLAKLLPDREGSLIPSLPATERLSMYTEANENFRDQLLNEAAVSRHLEKVGLEQSLLAPVIGGTLMTQGILYTVGYYHFPTNLRKQLSAIYAGTVTGTPGAGIAVLATAASLLANRAYAHHLQKEGRSPSQLIEDRLKHLDEVQAIVQAL